MHNMMDVEEENQTKIGSYCALCGLGTARTRECRVLYSCPQVVKNNGGVCGAMVIFVPGRYNFLILEYPRAVTRGKIFLQVFIMCMG